MTADRRDIPFSQRLQDGVVLAVSPTRVRLRLIDCAWAEQAIVPPDHLAEGKVWSDYAPGQWQRVFLRHRHEGQAGERFASLRWAEHNPWLVAPPRLGEIRRVRVDRMPTDEAAYAVTEDDDGIDVRIDRHELPGTPARIGDLLDPGDRLEVCLTEVERERLHVAGSVRQAMHRAHEEEAEDRRRVRYAGVVETIGRETWAAAHAWPGADRVAVALCLHDEYFAAHLRSWLAGVGVEAFVCKQADALLTLLEAADRPSRVLFSAAAWPSDRRTEQALRKRLSDPGLRVIWLGAPPSSFQVEARLVEARPEARAAPAVLNSPFELVDLLHALTAEPGRAGDSPPAAARGHAARPESAPVDGEGAGESGQGQGEGEGEGEGQGRADPAPSASADPVRRARALAENHLGEIAETFRLTAALWVAKGSDGRYRPVAAHGIAPDRLAAARLHRSPLVEAFQEGRVVEVTSPDKAGELADLSPPGTARLCILPFLRWSAESAEQRDAVVLFHAREERTQAPPPSPRHCLPGLRLAAEALRLAGEQANLIAFAQIGLNWSAYLHETRQAADALVEKIDQLAERARDGQTIEEGQWRVLSKSARHLHGIADAELDLVHKRQKPRASVRAIIERSAELLLHRFDLADCALSVRVPELPLTIALPPVVLEQALRHLLDNALDFARRRHAPGCAVELEVALADGEDGVGPAAALFVDVADNGPGVRAGWVERVFAPRDTDKGQPGSGLGLHFCRDLLREAGGDLRLLETLRWRRTVFRIVLPIRLAGH